MSFFEKFAFSDKKATQVEGPSYDMTPEEQSSTQKSDQELLEGGAKQTESGEIIPKNSQIAEAREEMEADFAAEQLKKYYQTFSPFSDEELSTLSKLYWSAKNSASMSIPQESKAILEPMSQAIDLILKEREIAADQADIEQQTKDLKQ